MNPTLRTAARLCVVAAFGVAALAQDQITAYRGATLWPGDGPPIERAVLVVAQGRVQLVGGETTAIPDGASVVDVTGHVITPGLIDASWNGGVAPADQNEQSDEITPALRALDGLDPMAPEFLRTRSAGVTTVHVMPGTRNAIGGLSAVVKTWAKDPVAMVVKDEAALRIVLGAEPSMGNAAIGGSDPDSMFYRRPTTRMGVIWAVRRAFYDAKESLARTADAVAGGADDRGTAVLARVLQGKLTAVTTARSEQDLRTALRLAEEFGYTPVIDEAQDAWRVVPDLGAHKVWVIAGAPSADRLGGSAAADGAEPRFSTLTAMQRAGVPFAIATGTNQLALDLVREATFAHRYGLSAQDALAAVTSQPARLLGIDDRTGRLSPGLDADFVVWSVDPFDPASEPLTVVVGGHDTPVLR